MENTKTVHLDPSKDAKICRKHFKDSDLIIDMDGKKRLASNAVPTLFLPLTLNWDHGYILVCKNLYDSDTDIFNLN